MSSKPALWVRASRAPFLSASLVPVLLGAFAAFWRDGSFSAWRLALTLAGIACVHLGANLANDYYDYKTGCDSENPEPTPFSGGSRVIQDGLISSGAIIGASAALSAVGAAIGLYLNSLVPGNGVIMLALAGIAGGFLYTAVPVNLSYRGLGEAVVFFCFGPLLVAGSYMVQAGRLDLWALAVSIPAGLLVLAILLVNEVLDVEWDGRAGKNTVVVWLGRERGYMLFLTAYTAAYVWIGLGIFLKVYQPIASVSAVPLLFATRRLAPGRALGNRPGTIEASRVTILSQAFTILLLSLSYLV
ncbi:MAG: 1,4-dihydroxy-2-naphthoate octaprenyltransferase [bacterium]